MFLSLTNISFQLLFNLFVRLLITIIISEPRNPESSPLPKCRHIDPYDRIDIWAWNDANSSSCDPITAFSEITDAREKERYKWGYSKFAYNLLVSDKIGPRRYLPPMYHELCSNIPYDGLTMNASIIIIYHNEALSVLIRMLNSIFDRTPSYLLKEVILFDDMSDEDAIVVEKVLQYANIDEWPWEKLIVKRSEKRLGLIRSKAEAAKLATGDIIIFLDSHCEVTDKWIEPLIAAIEEDPTRTVLPLVDLISAHDFTYTKAMVAKGAFDWSLNFVWKYFPWEYFDEPENNVKPFRSPIMSGGLLAIKREFFFEMGEYDTAMQIWGCENVEISLRMWLCGGSVVVAPCSRVGHVFRNRRPYKTRDDIDTHLFNCLRTVKVWFDDYEKYFYHEHPKAKTMDFGDLTERLNLKKSLNCKPFEWFLREVYPELIPQIKHEEL